MAQAPAKRKFPSYESESLDWTGETYIELEAFSFTWTIKNYEFLSRSRVLESPIFYGGFKTKHGWKLLMYPKRHEYPGSKCGPYVCICLKLCNYGDQLSELEDTPITTHFQISILNSEGHPQVHAFQEKKVHEFSKVSGQEECGNKFMIRSEQLVDPNRGLIANDTVRILCQVWIPGEMKEKVTNCNWKPSDEQKSTPKDRHAVDFGKMFSKSIGTDVTVSTGVTSFKAHKAILSARSSVFDAMFSADMMERETATVKIDDFDKEVVKGMLDHLYTGETNVMADRAQELLQIAEKYNLEGLKEDCEYSIADKLNKDNVAEILALAHSHNAPILKSHAISFINWNKEELRKMKSFQDAVKAFALTGFLVYLYLSSTKRNKSGIESTLILIIIN
ncbi:unnamed protein product [Orchesella dallaii]|uniref:Speckle-type POZ protein n=1 Tax=Orchesella dallaii TaxID=48710 RepID=A0ABP1R4X6_9HEXA